jgi:imidazolonepropionase-like amidohydrolase
MRYRLVRIAVDRVVFALLGSALVSATVAWGQGASKATTFVTVSEPVVVLTNVTVIDGTGAAPLPRQTIVVRDGKIAAVGPAASVQAPAGARVIDLPGSTVIPGLVGMHDHLFYTAVGGRETVLSFSGPRLYLGSGVTTIRTTGSVSAYSDIATKNAIDKGTEPGPHVYLTAPYITGNGEGSSGIMAVLNSPDEAKHFVDYWATEGVTWLKAYADIHRAELKAAIDEAHRKGIKVTGHLCSVTFSEAVDMGIDNLEHGYATATDFDPQKQPDVCPSGSLARVGGTTPDATTAQAVYKKMIDHHVSMTSTLSVIESLLPHRPYDPRTLDLMAPDLRTSFLALRAHIDSEGSWPFKTVVIKNAEAFEKGFVDAGGLMGAGCDPTGIGGDPPGIGDQRNYELLIEAGLTPQQVVQIMTANGAKILGAYDHIGSVERGKAADLVVLDGDLAADPTVIHKVTTVFKDGVGYDSPKLIASANGHLGIN